MWQVMHFWDIYRKWQKRWEEARVFEADPDNRPKIFINGAYPYVNGRPHIGHYFSTFLRPDVYARYKRMRGFNVLYPQGFHATGQPIAAAARRLREGDKKQRDILLSMGVKEEELDKFKDPKYWITYFMNLWIEDLKLSGSSIDWRRTFHTTEFNPFYDAFIRWQYEELRDKGVIERGKHPVVWCPKEEIPIADHDRSEGEGVNPEEIIVIKFKGDVVFPVATYRPETVYGVTNLWINPEAIYVKASVNNEEWIISKEASESISHQLPLEIVEEIKGEELIGKIVQNPVTGEAVPILPASFVDPSFGTGVVMSVPAHAPYDWVAYQEIKEKYYVLPPRSLIDLEGYSEFPAKDVVEKYGITSQEEKEKLDAATAEVYKKEFYSGVLKEIFGPYAGLKVNEAKDKLIKDFKRRGIATTIWILPRRVVCRCGAEGVVKIVEQWFLKYSDERWKALAREAALKTDFTPEEAKNAVLHTIEWLKEWPLTRDVRTSLGTRLPWDKDQYIESLSDSTIYMAFYTLSKYFNQMDDSIAKRLDRAFFRWVFYGEGDIKEISERTGIEEEILNRMREEFLYWYPTDVRFVGKDLLQNHVTFTIFHHALIFPEKHPRRWSAAGHVLLNGEKMSKSKGNFLLLREAIDKYGADPVRMAVALAGNTVLDDANIETEVMEELREELPRWLSFVEEWYGKGRENKLMVDGWIESEVSKIIRDVGAAYEELRLRDAAIDAWYTMWRIVRKYLQITRNNPNKEVISWTLESWIKILQPITPHFAEEAWERIGKEPFVGLSDWPAPVSADERLVKFMEYVENLIEDIRHAVKLSRIEEPTKVEIYIAEPWKYDIVKNVRTLIRKKPMEEVIRSVPEEYRKDMVPLIKRGWKDPSRIPEVIGSREEEKQFLKEVKDYIEESVGVPLDILDAPVEGKTSLPFKPAIIVRGSSL